MPVASISDGAEIPAYAGVVKGRTMASVPKCRLIWRSTAAFREAVRGRRLLGLGPTRHNYGQHMKTWIELLHKERERMEQST